MNEAAAKQYTIGIVAKNLGITSRSIKYYEEIGLMGDYGRTDSNYRVYGEHDIVRLKFILKLKELGISLKEMRELAIYYDLNIHGTEKIIPKLLDVIDLNIGKIDEKISNLHSLRKDIGDYQFRVMNCLRQKQKSCECK